MSSVSPHAVSRDAFYMQLAYRAAEQAATTGEVPIGALLLMPNGRYLVAGNETVCAKDPSAHAEIVVLRKAARELGNHRLLGCELFVTLEPCAMCAGAISQARIQRLVYAASDPKRGAVGSALNLLEHDVTNTQIHITTGVLAEPCGALLKQFFQKRR